MKTKNKPHYLSLAMIVAVISAATWSCNKDDDPSLAALRDDKLTYLEDSLRISDSLRRINSAGVVNYAITVVSGSTSTLFKSGSGSGRVARNKNVVSGAVVTISQFGKIEKDTTDQSGMVVFNGFFRTAVNVTVEMEGFTTVSYISVLNLEDETENSGIYFVGNIIPVFELAGENTATITGRATIQYNLTNRTRENVPDGTRITANIDATAGTDFANMFLTSALTYSGTSYDLIYVGNIIDAAYSTNISATTSGGNYTLTVPAAIDGLPLRLEYSAIATNQTLYENEGDGPRLTSYRTIFDPYFGGLSAIPDVSFIDVAFTGDGSGATAFAVVDNNGTISGITVTAGGSGYTTAPTVAITGGDSGSGATATAVITNGVVTSVVMNTVGAGYINGNTPPIDGEESFSATLTITEFKTGLSYINDIHYGTGVRQPN